MFLVFRNTVAIFKCPTTFCIIYVSIVYCIVSIVMYVSQNCFFSVEITSGKRLCVYSVCMHLARYFRLLRGVILHK